MTARTPPSPHLHKLVLHRVRTDINAVETAVRKVSHARPEALHNLRSALRRLRTSLALFPARLGRLAGPELDKELRTLIRLLGPARDADAQAELWALVAASLDATARRAWRAFVRQEHQRRVSLYAALAAALTGITMRGVVSRLRTLRDQQLPAADWGAPDAARVARRKVHESVDKLLHACGKARAHKPRRRFLARVAARHCLHAFALFQPHLPTALGPTRKLIARYESTLGRLHDLDLALDRLAATDMATTPYAKPLRKLRRQHRKELELQVKLLAAKR